MKGSTMTAPDFRPKKLVIFAGGKGTRLSELTGSVPKPAIDVLGRPLVTYLCDWAFKAGLKTVILAAGYKQAVLKRRVLDYFQLSGDVVITAQGVSYSRGTLPEGCEIIIRDTGPDADTAERLFAVRDLLAADETFMLTYGDTLTDLDAAALLQSAAQNNKAITMCIGRPDGRYGEIVSENGIVKAFKEKERPRFYVNRGFFVVKKTIFADWKPGYASFEQDMLPDFVARGDVGAHQDDCWFHSVDSVKDLLDLEAHLTATAEPGV